MTTSMRAPAGPEPIAIVGAGVVAPGAFGVAAYRARLMSGDAACRDDGHEEDGRCALGSDPRSDPRMWLGGASPARDAVRSLARHPLPLLPSAPPESLHLEPSRWDLLDPALRAALCAVDEAAPAGARARWDPTRGGVIVGQLVLPTRASTVWARHRVLAPFARARGLGDRLGPGASSIDARHTLAPAARPASVIARALGLRGEAMGLDAACASSSLALHYACRALRSRRLDFAIAGGLCMADPLYLQMGFSQLHALSPSGRCRPLDARADGLVVGEGACLFSLCRLGDALAQDLPILAVIRQVGLSTDRAGKLLAPAVEGQLRAMQAAYVGLDVQPRDVEFVECHATGTSAGDTVELESLRALMLHVPDAEPLHLGASKATFGHLLTGASALGVLSASVCLAHGVLPPVAGFAQPSPSLEGAGRSFRVDARARAWPKTGPLRVAAVDAFGFGGSNAHVVVESAHDPARLEALASLAAPTRSTAIAITGVHMRLGDRPESEQAARALLGLDPFAPATTPPGTDGGAPAPGRGRFVDAVEVPVGRDRVPPRELKRALPGQLLLLEAMHALLGDEPRPDEGDAHSDAHEAQALATACYVALDVDPATTDHGLRWQWLEAARNGAELPCDDATLDALGPPLDADGVLGGLGSIAASRVARAFRLGAPCHTVSCGESSGLRALALAVDELRAGAIDRALIGATDLLSDPRTRAALDHALPLASPSDGHAHGLELVDATVALRVERETDARAAGRPILAIIDGVGLGHGGPVDGIGADADALCGALTTALADAGASPSHVGHIEAGLAAHPSLGEAERTALESLLAEADLDDPFDDRRPSLGCVGAELGWAGISSGALALARLVFALHHRVRPRSHGAPILRTRVLAPRDPQPWLREENHPRRAIAFSAGVHGACAAVCLREGDAAPIGLRSTRAPSPFLLAASDRSALRQRAEDALAHARTLDEADRAALDAWCAQTLRDRDALAAPGVFLWLLVSSPAALIDELSACIEALTQDAPAKTRTATQGPRIRARDAAPRGELAFVFSGSGSLRMGTARELLVAFPGILAAQQEAHPGLSRQVLGRWAWNPASGACREDVRAGIVAQVALSTLLSDLARALGLRPTASLGYSLGESSGLFALGAWTDREAMLQRVERGPLFRTWLGGPCLAARRAWGLPEDAPAVEWSLGVVDKNQAVVRTALAAHPRAYLLIVNTDDECVIGGDAAAVSAVVDALGCTFSPLRGVSTVHCEVVEAVAEDYRALHRLPTTAPGGVRFYGGADKSAFIADRERAAASIVANATRGIDWPATVRQAYEDGVRIFVEIGPGASCTRMIEAILATSAGPCDRESSAHGSIGSEHTGARPSCVALAPSPHDGLRALLAAVGTLLEAGVAVDLEPLARLWDPLRAPVGGHAPGRAMRVATLRVEVGARGRSITIGARPRSGGPPDERSNQRGLAPSGGLGPSSPRSDAAARPHTTLSRSTRTRPSAPPSSEAPAQALRVGHASTDPRMVALLAAQRERVRAQTAWFDFAHAQREAIVALLAAGERADPRSMRDHAAAVQRLPSAPDADVRGDVQIGDAAASRAKTTASAPPPTPSTPPSTATAPSGPRALDRTRCLHYAEQDLAAVFGPVWADVDTLPTRVRLPAAPLMLVDRVVEIDAAWDSMTKGRLVTEHDVREGAWYLDGGRICASMAIESGQADLMLAGVLGVDRRTRGLACYRLLDATVEFLDALPAPGATVRYDIAIDGFFRQGDTWLFRFHFDATIDGHPLMRMRDGCAGFFSARELSEGKGLVEGPMRPPLVEPTAAISGWAPLHWDGAPSLDDAQLTALTAGDVEGAFGEDFARCRGVAMATLPTGPLRLLARVSELSLEGGRHGLGHVVAHTAIRGDEWFIHTHFVDDPVMPGTLMYECCLQALRIFMLRCGIVGPRDLVHYQPVPGVRSRLRCRGQVLEATRECRWEIDVSRVGVLDDGTPYAIADAKMIADGRPIVEVIDMSVRASGVDHARLLATWRDPARAPFIVAPGTIAGSSIEGIAAADVIDRWDRARLHECADGSLVAAFGPAWRDFDAAFVGERARFAARLPRPPFLCLDAVDIVAGRAGDASVLPACVAHVDVGLEDEWTVAARQRAIPYAILLETALQPCGLLAAWVGSALGSSEALYFRNLGGDTTILASNALPFELAPRDRLTVHARMTSLARSGGMVIQHFSIAVDSALVGPLMAGTTYFGFFSHAALAAQAGLKDAPRMCEAHERGEINPWALPDASPHPRPDWRMITRLDACADHGGRHGLGFALGSIDVDPSAWFFKAHFRGDPVWPGSLGNESALQLLAVWAERRWASGQTDGRAPRWDLEPASTPRWSYRGQILGSAKEVTVELAIRSVDDRRLRVRADAVLKVDGLPIYHLEGLGLRWRR